MTARGLIAHGGPQRLPTRVAPPDSSRSLRVAPGSPPWTPWTIRSRLDRPYHAHATYTYVGGVERRGHHAGLSPPVISVITITGIGDHLQPEWLITFTGIRTWVNEQLAVADAIGLYGSLRPATPMRSCYPRNTFGAPSRTSALRLGW